MAVPSPFIYGTGGLPTPAPVSVAGAALPPAMAAAQRKSSASAKAMAPAAAGTVAPVAVAPAAASYTPPATTPTAAPTITPLASAAYGGLMAGAPSAASYDTKSGLVATLGSAASGAAAGAVVGGPVGAIVGGGIGAITGGLNAWLSVGAANKAKRDQEKLLRNAEAKQARRDAIARDDAVSQLAYDRREANLQKKWAKSLQVRQAISQMTADGQSARDKFVSTGRV